MIRSSRKTLAIVTGMALLIAIFVAIAVPRYTRWQAMKAAEVLLSKSLPPLSPPVTQPTGSGSLSSDSGAVVTANNLPAEINLPVPFTVQAPDGDWAMPYQEACEEAAALMAIRYVFGTPFLSPADADAAILDLVKTNAEILGFPVDQTAEQVMALIHAVDPQIPVALVQNPTVELLKEQLALKHVIIVPTAGRKLNNPFYHAPGPRYHMLVLRGYTADGYFITNDAGTKRGENYLYPFDLLMNAMGDWNNGDPENGAKVALVVKPIGG